MPAQKPPHDAFFKEVFSRAKTAKGELEAMLPKALVAELDFSTAQLHSGSFVDEQLRQRHSDLLWSVRLRGREALLYVLLEHQSRPDPLMPFRILRYMVRIWDRWLRRGVGGQEKGDALSSRSRVISAFRDGVSAI